VAKVKIARPQDGQVAHARKMVRLYAAAASVQANLKAVGLVWGLARQGQGQAWRTDGGVPSVARGRSNVGTDKGKHGFCRVGRGAGVLGTNSMGLGVVGTNSSTLIRGKRIRPGSARGLGVVGTNVLLMWAWGAIGTGAAVRGTEQGGQPGNKATGQFLGDLPSNREVFE
jgi:hypothetical protein